MPHTPESHKHLTKDYNSSRKLISEPSQSNARAADIELTHSGCDKTGTEARSRCRSNVVGPPVYSHLILFVICHIGLDK